MSSGCLACEVDPTPKIEKVGRFDELLQDSQLFSAFEEFLQREFAEENLYFYRDVMKFEELSRSEPDEVLKKHAQAIADKYLGCAYF